MDDKFGDAAPAIDSTRQRCDEVLRPLLNRGFIPVVKGFSGATLSAQSTTLGRCGSDYSTTILGAAMKADGVWIWADVDGVLTADPRVRVGIAGFGTAVCRQSEVKREHGSSSKVVAQNDINIESLEQEPHLPKERLSFVITVQPASEPTIRRAIETIMLLSTQSLLRGIRALRASRANVYRGVIQVDRI